MQKEVISGSWPVGRRSLICVSSAHLGNVRTDRLFVVSGVSLRSHLFHILDLFIKSLCLSVGALIRNSMVRIDSQYGIYCFLNTLCC